MSNSMLRKSGEGFGAAGGSFKRKTMNSSKESFDIHHEGTGSGGSSTSKTLGKIISPPKQSMKAI
jgi:hypothetical protein